jgi:hypothetical protein
MQRLKASSRSMSDSDVKTALRRLRPEKYGESLWVAPSEEVAVSAPAPVDIEQRKRLVKEVCELAGVDSSDADATEQLLLKATGVKTVDLANQILSGIASLPSTTELPGGPGRLLATAAMLLEFKPQTITESLLASQMIGVHHGMLIALRKAFLEDQHPDIADAYIRRAASLGRLFIQQTEALRQLQGNSTTSQKVTVEHVHVHDGGQAIVGAVERAAGLGEGGKK